MKNTPSLDDQIEMYRRMILVRRLEEQVPKKGGAPRYSGGGLRRPAGTVGLQPAEHQSDGRGGQGGNAACGTGVCGAYRGLP